MRFIYFIICFTFYSSVFAKNISTDKVITVADSILVSKVGENLKKYFELSTDGSHYKYLVSNKRMETEQFLDLKKIKKDVTEIWVLYHFNYTKIEGMKAGIWIKLDSNLQLIEEPNLNMVPEFLINTTAPSFISKKDAKAIALKIFTEKGADISEPKLQYVKKNEKYIYTIANKTMKQNIREMEIVELDVFTGKLLSKYESYNGLIEK